MKAVVAQAKTAAVVFAPAMLFYLSLSLIFLSENKKLAVNSYRLLVLVPVLLFVVFHFRSQVKKLLAYQPARWFLLYAAWMSLSLWWGDRPDKAAQMIAAVLSALMLFFALMYLAQHRPSHLKILPTIYMMLSASALVMTLWCWTGITTLDRYTIGHGVFDVHPRVGSLAACLIFLSVFALWYRSPSCMKWMAWCVLPIGLLTLCASQSRGAFILLATATVLWLYQGRKTQKAQRYDSENDYGTARVAGVILPVMFAVFVAAFLAYAVAAQASQEWPAGTSLADSFWSRGLMDRDLIWANARDIFLKHPANLVWGFGWTTSADNVYGGFTANHFHSLYVNTVFYGGAIGLFFLLAYLYTCIRSGLKHAAHEPWVYLVAGSVAAGIFDMETLLVNPSSVMLTFLLPSFLVVLKEKVYPADQPIEPVKAH